MRCANCEENKAELLKTAYGDFICEDCWYDYVCSDVGKLEYLIGICKGDYPADEFDSEFLGEVALSYRINYEKLDLTAEQLTEIEQKAMALGIL